MKRIFARLLDNQGFTITECECETKKEAKERCKYYLSDAYAQQAETTHGRLGTKKAEVVVDGTCAWDIFYEPKPSVEYTFRVAKGHADAPIERIKVVRRTATTLILSKGLPGMEREFRELTETSYHIHFGSLPEAKAYCIKCCEAAIRQSEAKLARYRYRLNKLQEMAVQAAQGKDSI